MTQEARSTTARGKKNHPAPAKHAGRPAANMAAFVHYQSALQLLQQGKYDKALAALEKVLQEAPPELKERCQMYIVTCRRQMEAVELVFETPEEHYDYAVSQLNTGYFEEAREHFQAILSRCPQADYAYYGLALLESLTGRPKDCLANLAQAIDLNPKNRLQARVDNDFQNMADDPRFTELLYPEP